MRRLLSPLNHSQSGWRSPQRSFQPLPQRPGAAADGSSSAEKHQGGATSPPLLMHNVVCQSPSGERAGPETLSAAKARQTFFISKWEACPASTSVSVGIYLVSVIWQTLNVQNSNVMLRCDRSPLLLAVNMNYLRTEGQEI